MLSAFRKYSPFYDRTRPVGLTLALRNLRLLRHSGHFLHDSHPAGFYLIHAIGLALAVDLFRVALAGHDDDLVERRRPIRLWLQILVAAQSGAG